MTESNARRPSSLELGRRAFRRRQSRRSVLVSVVSTIVVAVAAWLLVTNAPGWPRVRQSFFDGPTLVAALPRVLEGFVVNLRVLGYSIVAVAVFSLLLATLRTLRGPVFFPLRALAIGYADLFRGLPLIVVLYLVGFGIPGLRLTDGRIPAELLGTLALTLTYSAYVSEVWRAGIEAVHPSQVLAARSLGLSHGQSMRLIVLPQALRKVTPALMNDLVSMQKDVGLISVLGAVDAVRRAQIETSTAANFTPYVVAGLVFVVLALPLIRLTDWLSARARRREQIGAVL
ncbi:amino acid ABC transporter permease [Galbitalea sp. SE-J8]|uniref:amino acid ABC transporter permease n=1 Tax=Galbitalea sp. SE-J8 TaxID=3054952 RepID=UPI00259CE58B|nr:amino acid ABC transporter permease [Galbitalea sp. SE-J8]MDM4764151.1 amino acid ABC transporter permease [Galbitalea sp. SE-J8]